MALCLLSVALAGVQPRLSNLSGERLEVNIDGEMGRNLFVPVLEGKLVLAFLWYLNVLCSLPYAPALGLVGLK